jgi:hypothetical protein
LDQPGLDICSACGGTGTVHFAPVWPQTCLEPDACPECVGTGRCPLCGGKLWPPDEEVCSACGLAVEDCEEWLLANGLC